MNYYYCKNCNEKVEVIEKNKKSGILYFKHWCFCVGKWVYFKIPGQNRR